MNNEQLNASLYNKLNSELQDFIHELQISPSESVIEQAYELIIKEDIIMALECDNIDSAKCRALLKEKNGSYSTNYQISGRELLTPDEVRLLDNRYALLFIRGERPVKDLKYDILKHPNVKLSKDGGTEPYIHGFDDYSSGTLSFEDTKMTEPDTNIEEIDSGSGEFVIYSSDEIEALLDII